MRAVVIVIALIACGDDDGVARIDAPPQMTDAPPQMTDAPVTPLTCEGYCATITSVCNRTAVPYPNAQYASLQDCLDTCATLAVGAAGETTGNTLACRVTHVDLARSNPMFYCDEAGPSGGGSSSGGPMCGTACDAFCTIVTAVCPSQWPSLPDCMGACSLFPASYQYVVPQGGDTVGCRLYHATMAATDPAAHCQHTTPQSVPCNQ